MTLSNLKKEIRKAANPEKAAFHMKYFKTAKGEYGEGDVFLGLTVPASRLIAKKFAYTLDLEDVQKLLEDKIHEYRFVALEILVFKLDKAFKERNEKEQKRIVSFYLKNTRYINNWDLVDTSALYILGAYYFDKDKKVLYKLAKSKNIWERRIAIVSTFYFIKKGEYDDTLKISEILMNDKHDLIHKAVGWMLREVGNMDAKVEKHFLSLHAHYMPRTMLRYAIEKLSVGERKEFLNMKNL